MTTPANFFSRSEFDHRLQSCKQRMAENGIDVLVESDPGNMYYLTGYDACSFYVPQAVVVDIQESEPTWFGRPSDVSAVHLTTDLDENNIITYPEDSLHRDDVHPMDHLGKQLTQGGSGSKRIGIASDCYNFTPRCAAAIRKSMPNARFVDSKHLVNWLRLVKSDAEVEAIRKAAKITERMMQAFFDGVQPGVRHCDVVAEVYSASVRGLPEYGGEFSAAPVLMPKGSNMTAPHLTWSDEIFEANEAVFMEIAGVKHRYHCPLARTLQLGTPSSELLNASKGVEAGLEAGLAVAKCGNTVEDIAVAFSGAISEFGLEKDARVGYSIGIAYPLDWGEHTVSIRKGDTTELLENMTFHLMAGIWFDDFGIASTETFRVTNGEPELFTSVPRELHVKS